MKHNVIIYSIINNVCREISVSTEELKEVVLFDKKITTLDRIYRISFATNMVLIETSSPENRYAPAPNPDYVPNYSTYNYINAYDYSGNHLWNIAEIIGDVGSGVGGHICSTKYLLGDAKEKYNAGHELFVCWNAYGMRYLIDLDEKRVIHKMMTR